MELLILLLQYVNAGAFVFGQCLDALDEADESVRVFGDDTRNEQIAHFLPTADTDFEGGNRHDGGTQDDKQDNKEVSQGNHSFFKFLQGT